jgi:F-type H+-transporting ATPase subunit c
MTVSAAKLIGAGVATVGLVGPGTGAGVIFAGLLLAASYNPFHKGLWFSWAILGFALTEALALFALMMAFLILFAF